MTKRREDYEVMAPVGSYESLMAAIQGGADAVYFGVGQLNMRARSSANFTVDDLPKIISTAKENNCKSYLTLNTVVYNNELDQMREMIDLSKKYQVDALIISDQAALSYASKSGVEIHLSTQLNISNIETLKFYAKFADVVVLARELNLQEVAEIHHIIQDEEIRGPSGELIRIELFVHGALCMAISGKCYLSLHEHNHSANRGDCFQVCRSSYLVKDQSRDIELKVDNKNIMSPKDLSTIHFLNKILDAGVSVLKIEGRARSPEYVKTVVSCYNEAIQAHIEGNYTREKIENWTTRLKRVFNRGFWDGYYLGQKLGEWSEVYGSAATTKKIFIGKVTNYFDKIGVAEFFIETGELSVGDNIIIIGPTTGVIETTVEELRVDEKPCSKAKKGEQCSLPVKELVRRSDKLYKVVERTLKNN
ncbi:MAG TPA: peptidase U32 family protein [Bacteroidales bacterium]|nr:peptidase U32 family protein [Bacteroidales bacterium]